MCAKHALSCVDQLLMSHSHAQSSFTLQYDVYNLLLQAREAEHAEHHHVCSKVGVPLSAKALLSIISVT